MRKVKEKYSKENFEKIIKESTTFKEVAKKLDILYESGYNYKTIKKYIKLYNLDTSHFESMEIRLKKLALNWSRTRIPMEKILVENSAYGRTNLKRRLYKLGLKERNCELCGQGERWNGKKMSLILDHANGVHNDNRIENLRIVCPNCNATLDTHCGKNLKKKRLTQEEIDRKEKEKKLNIHEGILKTRKVDRPPYETLKKETFENGFSATGRKYGVSDNAIRKWIKYYEKHELELIE